jgi:AraC-like DNA-binding protein
MVLPPEAFAGLCRAREFLRETHDTHASIVDAAREAGMSPFHFIRRFEALFGQTPHQFRIESRLDRAKILLARGDSVTDVCLEVGCSSLGSFSYLFAKRVGESPSAFRKRARLVVPAPAFPHPLFPGCLSLMRFAIFEKRSESAFR